MHEAWLGMMLWALSLWSGLAVAEGYRARPRQIRVLREALVRMETEIVYGRTALEEIFRRLAAGTSGPLTGFFAEVAEVIAGGTDDLAPAFRQAVERHFPRAHLGREEQAAVSALAEVLGRTDGASQIRHLRLALSALEALEARAREEEARYGRLARAFGFLFGLFLLVLFL